MKKFLKNRIVTIVIIFVLLSFVFSGIVTYTNSNFNGVVIVLDAGHGGRDGGSVGVNGTIEKEINLKYTLMLKEKLTNFHYKVVLTRATDDGLYSPLAKNKKLSDMNKRMEIIKNANPNLVVSIHMNSFADHSASGAVTYHKVDDDASIRCAELIQKSLKADCNAKTEAVKAGDFYLLNCSYYTSVLVECGFLSNANEEQQLNTNEYMDKLTTSIANGIFLYFGDNTI